MGDTTKNRGRQRGPIENPYGSAESWLLGERKVTNIMEARKLHGPVTPGYLSTLFHGDLVNFAWPIIVMKHCYYMATASHTNQAIPFHKIYQRDKAFVSEMLAAITQAVEDRQSTPPSRWDWKRLIYELENELQSPTEVEMTEEELSNRNVEELYASWTKKDGPWLKWGEIRRIAIAKGCQIAAEAPPQGRVDKEDEDFAKRIFEAAATMRREVENWRNQFMAWDLTLASCTQGLWFPSTDSILPEEPFEFRK
jgi:hypothetical protein